VTTDFLSKIISNKKAYLTQKKKSVPQMKLKEEIANSTYSNRSFEKALKKPNAISLIAEIKKASPSRGILREDFNPVALGAIYRDCGVDALSVLTEEDYFQGKLSYIKDIRQKVDLPILGKDFIIDEYQIYESHLGGADAILLIAALLSVDQLRQFLNLAEGLDLECLVEVHNEDDLKKVLTTNAQIIGINNRDLRTFDLDINTTERLTSLIPKGKTVVSESGIKTRADVQRLSNLGINSILIGEAFMVCEDIGAKIKELMG